MPFRCKRFPCWPALLLCALALGSPGCGGGGGGGSAPATDPVVGLLAFDQYGNLFEINSVTGAARPGRQVMADEGKGPFPLGEVSSAIYDDTQGALWLGIGSESGCDACFAELDPASGDALPVVSHRALTSAIYGLAQSASGEVFAVFDASGDSNASRLMRISGATSDAQEVGELVGTGYDGRGLTFAQGALYFGGSDTLFTLNPSTGLETEVAPFTLTGLPSHVSSAQVSVKSMTTIPTGATFALAEVEGPVGCITALAQLNLSTAELTFIGPTGAYVDGLVYSGVALDELPVASSARLRHHYALDGSLGDELGGPSLSSGGGTLEPTRYRFLEGQGVSLSNGIDAVEYSIEMRFTLDSIEDYLRILDFTSLEYDNGHYNYDGVTCSYDDAYGANPVLAEGRSAHFVLTRTNNDVTTVYVDGVPQVSYFDSDGNSVADGPSNIVWFMRDDEDEHGAGFLDDIKIYDGVLTPAQVRSLHAGGTVP